MKNPFYPCILRTLVITIPFQRVLRDTRDSEYFKNPFGPKSVSQTLLCHVHSKINQTYKMSSQFDSRLFSFLSSLKETDFGPVYVWTEPRSTPAGLIPAMCLMIDNKSKVKKFIRDYTGCTDRIDCIQLANETLRF